MNHQSEMVAVAQGVDLGPVACLPDKRIVARNTAIVIQAKDLAVSARGVLRLFGHAGRGRGHQNRAVQSEGQARPADIRAWVRAVKFLHLRE